MAKAPTRRAPAKTKAPSPTAEGSQILTNLAEARALFEEAQRIAVEAGLETVSAPAAHSVKDYSDTVWVGCKMPKGIVIQLHQQCDIEQKVLGGGVRIVPVPMRVGEQVRLRGFAVPFGVVPKHTIVGDFGLTEVKREFWETWCRQNPKLDMLTSGLIFWHSDKIDAEAEAAEKADDIKCGLEALNPKGDARVPKVASSNMTEIDVDGEMNAYKNVA